MFILLHMKVRIKCRDIDLHFEIFCLQTIMLERLLKLFESITNHTQRMMVSVNKGQGH